MAQLRRKIVQAAEPVQPPVPEGTRIRQKELPKTHYQEVGEASAPDGRKTKEFTSFEVVGSKGKKYKVTVPASYAHHIPKVWEWDTVKLQVAEDIANGISISQIVQDPAIGIKSRMTIYAWLEHPEFKEHVDALVLETGFANQRERLAGMNRLTNKLFDKIIRELDGVKLTDKSLGAIISGIHAGMKHLAQEKGEFIEQQNVTQETTLTGKMALAHVEVGELMKGKTDEERKALEAEFDSMGDDIIRAITGDK